jgi:hypothetical protein
LEVFILSPGSSAWVTAEWGCVDEVAGDFGERR